MHDINIHAAAEISVDSCARHCCFWCRDKPDTKGLYLSSIGVVPNGDVCISSALQHPDIGGIQSCSCEAVSNGVHILAKGMVCCCSVAIQHSIEGRVFDPGLNGFAVLISCLLMPLLLEGSIASLQPCPSAS